MIKAMKDFQIPMRVEVDKDAHSPTFGRFTTEAFERGFGTTIGNALRRILLSSLTGAAVTTVKIEGVVHEFSTISGVTEDVTAIILNIKSLRLALHTDKPKTIRLKKKGPGEAKGADILHDGDVTILTPDLHIATLDKDATLDIEMTVKHGRGYVPAERNKEEGLPIGVMTLTDELSSAKLLIAPSLGNESFGMVITRALACATPVVASDIPGYREVVTAETGVLTPPGDSGALAGSIAALLADEPRRSSMGAAARERAVSEYAWPLLARRLADCYERVLAG